MLTKTNITRARLLFAIAAALTVSACGDGGSGASSTAPPTLTGVPTGAQNVQTGIAAALAHFTVADVDSATLTVTLTPTNGTINGLTDADTGTAGIQLTGTAASINAAIAGATFTAASMGAASIGISVTDGTNTTTGSYNFAVATSSLTQGRWTSTNLTPAYTAIMVPAPTGANTPAVDTVWALAHDGSTLIKLKANGLASTAGAVSGDVHTLGTSSVTAVSGSSYTVSSTATPQFSIDPLLGTTAVFERADAMSTALAPNQANGTWQADLGKVKVNWTVTTAGASANNLSGSYSTTGCTFSGQSTVVSSQSLYKVTYTESCSDGTVTPFAGIGTLSPDNNRLTVVATNEAGTRAAALLFVKQP